MRILVVSNLYAPLARGGAESIARQTVLELKRQGHDVSVLTTSNTGTLRHEREGGVRVYRYRPALPYHILEDAKQPLWKRLFWHAKDLAAFGSFKVMKSVLADVKPDIVVTHNLRGMGMSLIQPLRLYKIRWAHVLHDVQLLVPSGLWWQDRGGLWQSEPIMRGYQAWLRSMMASPELVIGPTNYILNAHKERGFFGKSEQVMLQNPLALPEKIEDVPRGSGKGLQLVYVGQLSENKGVHVLLSALEHVSGSVQLDLIGSGPEEVALKQQALTLPNSVEVRFHGRVPHAEVFGYMKSADAVLLPSLAIENCPGVVLEARSVGARVIASRVGGVTELVPENGLVEPGDVRGLAQKIEDLKHGGVDACEPGGILSLEEYVHQFVAVLTSSKRS